MNQIDADFGFFLFLTLLVLLAFYRVTTYQDARRVRRQIFYEYHPLTCSLHFDKPIVQFVKYICHLSFVICHLSYLENNGTKILKIRASLFFIVHLLL